MRVHLVAAVGVGLLSVAFVGCEGSRSPAPMPTEENRRAGEVDVNTGPGGVDVEVGREGDAKKAVDVNVSPGGVNVDVDGEKIRERIQERQEERQEQP